MYYASLNRWSPFSKSRASKIRKLYSRSWSSFNKKLINAILFPHETFRTSKMSLNSPPTVSSNYFWLVFNLYPFNIEVFINESTFDMQNFFPIKICIQSEEKYHKRAVSASLKSLYNFVLI